MTLTIGLQFFAWHGREIASKQRTRWRGDGVPFLEEAEVGLGQQAEVGVELLYGRAVAAVGRCRA